MQREIRQALARVLAARDGLNSDDPQIVKDSIVEISSAILELDSQGVQPDWELEQICDLSLDLEIEDPISESYGSKMAALKALVKEL